MTAIFPPILDNLSGNKRHPRLATMLLTTWQRQSRRNVRWSSTTSNRIGERAREREKSKSKSKFRVSFYLHSSTEIKHSFPFRAVKLWEIYLVSKQLRSGFATAGMSSLAGDRPRERGGRVEGQNQIIVDRTLRDHDFLAPKQHRVCCWAYIVGKLNNRCAIKTKYRLRLEDFSEFHFNFYLSLYYFIFFSSRSPPLFFRMSQ